MKAFALAPILLVIYVASSSSGAARTQLATVPAHGQTLDFVGVGRSFFSLAAAIVFKRAHPKDRVVIVESSPDSSDPDASGRNGVRTRSTRGAPPAFITNSVIRFLADFNVQLRGPAFQSRLVGSSFERALHQDESGFSPVSGNLHSLRQALTDLATHLGVEFHYDTRALNVIDNGDGTVDLLVESPRGEIAYSAQRVAIGDGAVATSHAGGLGRTLARSTIYGTVPYLSRRFKLSEPRIDGHMYKVTIAMGGKTLVGNLGFHGNDATMYFPLEETSEGLDQWNGDVEAAKRWLGGSDLSHMSIRYAYHNYPPLDPHALALPGSLQPPTIYDAPLTRPDGETIFYNGKVVVGGDAGFQSLPTTGDGACYALMEGVKVGEEYARAKSARRPLDVSTLRHYMTQSRRTRFQISLNAATKRSQPWRGRVPP